MSKTLKVYLFLLKSSHQHWFFLILTHILDSLQNESNPKHHEYPPPSSIKSIIYSWSSRGTQEQWWLNDAMAGKEKGGEKAKAPGHPSCIASQGLSLRTTLVLWTRLSYSVIQWKTQKILRWVRKALRCHIIKFVKINLAMYGLWDWEWLQVLTAGKPKTTSAGHSQDFPDTGIQAHVSSCFLPPVALAS